MSASVRQTPAPMAATIATAHDRHCALNTQGMVPGFYAGGSDAAGRNRRHGPPDVQSVRERPAAHAGSAPPDAKGCPALMNPPARGCGDGRAGGGSGRGSAPLFSMRGRGAQLSPKPDVAHPVSVHGPMAPWPAFPAR